MRRRLGMFAVGIVVVARGLAIGVVWVARRVVGCWTNWPANVVIALSVPVVERQRLLEALRFTRQFKALRLRPSQQVANHKRLAGALSHHAAGGHSQERTLDFDLVIIEVEISQT